MTDKLEHFGVTPEPDPARPLRGMTVLVVEDSRFASEAIRLLCLRSGARIRRADTLAAAHRHLSVYRPSVVIVDLGLPDGSGLDLIDELAAAQPRVPALFGISGDDTLERSALAAGADGFFPKPMESLAHFQQTVLAQVRDVCAPARLQAVSDDVVVPDHVALQDDIDLMTEAIQNEPAGDRLDYIAHFLSGVGRVAHDDDLIAAAQGLARARAEGRGMRRGIAHIAHLLDERRARLAPL